MCFLIAPWDGQIQEVWSSDFCRPWPTTCDRPCDPTTLNLTWCSPPRGVAASGGRRESGIYKWLRYTSVCASTKTWLMETCFKWCSSLGKWTCHLALMIGCAHPNMAMGPPSWGSHVTTGMFLFEPSQVRKVAATDNNNICSCLLANLGLHTCGFGQRGHGEF